MFISLPHYKRDQYSPLSHGPTLSAVCKEIITLPPSRSSKGNKKIVIILNLNFYIVEPMTTAQPPVSTPTQAHGNICIFPSREYPQWSCSISTTFGHSCPVCLLFSQCCGCGCWEYVLPLSRFPSPDLFIWYPMLTLVSCVCVKCSCPHSPASTWGLRHRQDITNYVHGPWSDNVYTIKVSGLGVFCIWPHWYCKMFDT